MFATVHTEPVSVAVVGGTRSCDVCGAIYRNELVHCPNDGNELRLMTADPLVGNTIDNHYVVDALIGEGAMGRVYRAHHSRLMHKRYALKVLLGDLAATPGMRLRFQNEAESASRLDHPNIVGVVDFGRTRAGLMYLVMELVEGPSLRRVVKETVMSPERVVAIGKQIASGLAHAHARGVVHRDLKPDNVLLVGDTAMLADFGLAITSTTTDARLTTSGVMCTPLYAAPEQLLGKDIDHRVDLYALGATLYELLVGKPVFAGDANQVVAQKLAGKAPRLSTEAPQVPRGLAAIIEKLLERKPGMRYQSASEVVDALDRALSSARRVSVRSAIAGAALVVGLGATANAWHGTGGGAVASAAEAPAAAVVAGAPGPGVGPRASGLVPRVELPELASIALVVPAIRSFVDFVFFAPTPKAQSPKPKALLPAARAPIVSTRRPRPAASHVAIVSLDVRGPVSPQVIRRALERVAPVMKSCAGEVGGASVSATFSIGESKRATGLRVQGTGARCLQGALAGVRLEENAELGETNVAVRVAFSS